MEKILVLVLGSIAILFITAALGISLILIKKYKDFKAKKTVKKP